MQISPSFCVDKMSMHGKAFVWMTVFYTKFWHQQEVILHILWLDILKYLSLCVSISWFLFVLILFRLALNSNLPGQSIINGKTTDFRDYEPASASRKKLLPVLEDTMINSDSLEMCQRYIEYFQTQYKTNFPFQYRSTAFSILLKVLKIRNIKF